MAQTQATRRMVRITDEDGGVLECSLESFLKENADTLDDEEIRSLKAGDVVALGGGAQPLVRVEVVR